MQKPKCTILFSGGGTLGPVTPLLGMQDLIQKEFADAEFLWIGTRRGPERSIVTRRGIPFYSIVSAKLRRYISIWNFLDPILFFIAFFQSLFLLFRYRPILCIAAGGYVCVPVHLAAWCLRIPTWIHQQDVEMTLSNKLLAPLASTITVALESGKKLFPKYQAFWIGNPVREDILTGKRSEAKKIFGLKGTLPVVLVFGGGTGSKRINELVLQALKNLQDRCEIIHVTGPDRAVDSSQKLPQTYHAYSFLNEEMKHAYAAADLVVCRGGFGALSELSALKKPVILIPKPGHQEKNARFFWEGQAVVVCREDQPAEELAFKIQSLFENTSEKKSLGTNLSEMLPKTELEDVIHLLRRFLSV